MKRLVCLVLFLLGAPASDALAQKPDGYVSLGFDALPNAPDSPCELRGRLFVDELVRSGSHLSARAAGSVDGVIRGCNELFPEGGLIRGGHELRELYAEFAAARADLRVGYSRIVWGRLDEVQPTDVINPLDLTRFFFEGRSEARIAVPLVRARLFFGEHANVDALVVPGFRRGRFDQLHEPSSPFNLEPAGVPVVRLEPAATFGNLQGGARFSATTGRVDWSLSTFRGFDTFGSYVPQPLTRSLVQLFPRYTMIGGDFETARGRWALRGEVAHFAGELDTSDGGIGVDRRAGDAHVSGTVLVHHEPDYTSMSIVAAADRAFGRERYRTRAFAVYNVTEGATFLRTIASMELRDNVTLEGSIGWFFGGDATTARRDIINRFSDRDFLYARLKWHF